MLLFCMPDGPTCAAGKLQRASSHSSCMPCSERVAVCPCRTLLPHPPHRVLRSCRQGRIPPSQVLALAAHPTPPLEPKPDGNHTVRPAHNNNAAAGKSRRSSFSFLTGHAAADPAAAASGAGPDMAAGAAAAKAAQSTAGSDADMMLAADGILSPEEAAWVAAAAVADDPLPHVAGVHETRTGSAAALAGNDWNHGGAPVVAQYQQPGGDAEGGITVRVDTAVPSRNGSWHISGLHARSKYMEPVAVEVAVTLGGA